MEKHFLVFWNDNRATVAKIQHPPHDEPRGSVLETLLRDYIAQNETDYDGETLATPDVLLNGAVELTTAAWAVGHTREIVIGNGAVASVECTGGDWRVVL